MNVTCLRVFILPLLLFLSCSQPPPAEDTTGNADSSKTSTQKKSSTSKTSSEKNDSLGNSGDSEKETTSKKDETKDDEEDETGKNTSTSTTNVKSFSTLLKEVQAGSLPAVNTTRETTVTHFLVNQNCLPANVTQGSCEAHFKEWISYKLSNANQNALSQNITVCQYNKNLVEKYVDIRTSFCTPPNGQVPAQMQPMTIGQYCQVGDLTLNLAQERQIQTCP